jgi:hypothetical protein
MTPTQEQLEWIVAEVIRRLGAAQVTDPAANGALVIDDALITLSTLQGRIHGVSSVRVARRAVVTPAARDELRENGIELVRG